MVISKIVIKGFRNFINTEIDFSNVSLIIGKNDIGKSNLLYALRILFDKKISEADLELTDSDFNVYSSDGIIQITAYLSEITETCLVACDAFKGNISKDDTCVIRYQNEKDEDGYKIYIGQDETKLQEVGSRRYIKRLSLYYVDSQRDLISFYKQEKKRLLDSSKDRLSEKEITDDEISKASLKEDISSLNGKICGLNYISNALNQVNDVLKTISSSYTNNKVKFMSVEPDVEKMLEKVEITSFTESGDVAMGGDGRNNQIYLATWLTQRELENDDSNVMMFAIEEPESHLHPHQQRVLANYLMSFERGQVFITSHSPQIVSRFSPNCIIRLSEENKNVVAFCGKNAIVKDSFDKFGYRLNPISSEIFYSDGVLLVEGVSEVLFYKALAEAKDLGQDKYNFSIISVEGIGFRPYIELCKSLGIPFSIRTDNDIFSSKKDKSALRGISRCFGILKDYFDAGDIADLMKEYNDHQVLLEWDGSALDIPKESIDFSLEMRCGLEKFDIFLSDIDLENDILNSELNPVLKKHYSVENEDVLISKMKERKAENMFDFINNANTKTALKKVNKDSIIKPLLATLAKVKV